MYKAKMKAYEGNEPFIFISYAHRDSDTVLPFLDALAEDGYRIWYDDGIAPGSEWPEYIAQHLNACQVVMAFVSPRSIESPNCRREVTYALAKNKRFLGVLLEPTQMSAGMELQLSAQQCVFRDNFRDPASGEYDDRKLIEKITSTEEIQSCRESRQEDLDELLAREQAAADEASRKLKALKEAEEKRLAAQKELEALSAQKITGADDSEAKTGLKKKTLHGSSGGHDSDKAEKNGKKKKGTFKRILFSAAAIIALIAVYFTVSSSSVKFGEHSSAGRDSSSIEVKNETVDASLIRSLNKFRQLKYLRFTDCRMEADLSGLKKLDKIAALEFTDCSAVPSYDFLAGMPELKTLKISGCGLTDGQLPKLEGITSLDLSGNPEFADCGILPETLDTLDLSAAGVNDLSPLGRLSKLRNLTMDGCTKAEDWEILAGLSELRKLSLKNCGIISVDSALTALSLNELYLDGNPLQDIAFLNNITRLQILSAANCTSDFSAVLDKNFVTLTKADLSGTEPANTAALKNSIKQCLNLTSLSVCSLDLKDLEFISSLKNLQFLYAENCELEDITGLKDSASLSYLDLAHNRIRNAECLGTLGTEHQIYIDLHDNLLAALDYPAKTEVLLLYGNPEGILETLPDGHMINRLAADYDAAVFAKGDPFGGNDQLRYIYLLDVPMDKVLDIKDMLKPYFLKLCDRETFEHAMGDISDMSSMYDLKIE